MPIKPIILQRRLTEVGRIRIGEVVATKSGRRAPAKLDRFRFTSPDRILLDKIATLYGGEVQQWTPQNGVAAQWEVKSDADSIPILVPPQPVSQYMEHWSGGGCQRRCDGETELRSGNPCLCAAAENMLCKPTTRLSVMLRDVESIGVFRLESKGWNAAAELPGMAELLAQAGGYIQARLYLQQVRDTSDGQTRDYMVPKLAVDGITPAQLLAGGGPATAAIASQPGVAAIEAPRPDYAAMAGAAATVDEVRGIWHAAGQAGHLTPDLEQTLTARVKALSTDASGAGDGPPLPDGMDADTVWVQIVAACPEDWTDARTREEFARFSGGLMADSAEASELWAFLQHVKSAAVTA